MVSLSSKNRFGSKTARASWGGGPGGALRRADRPRFAADRAW